MNMNWLRALIAKFIYPAMMPALDECNKRNLAGYFKEREGDKQMLTVFMDEQRDYMRKLYRSEEETAKFRTSEIEGLKEIAEAIRGMRK